MSILAATVNPSVEGYGISRLPNNSNVTTQAALMDFFYHNTPLKLAGATNYDCHRTSLLQNSTARTDKLTRGNNS